MTTLDPDMGALVAEALRGLEVDVRVETAVTGFETTDGRVRAVTTDGGELPADLVILGLGVRPSVDVARAAGVPVGAAGGIAADRRMRTAVDGAWAAGGGGEGLHLGSRRPAVVGRG